MAVPSYHYNRYKLPDPIPISKEGTTTLKFFGVDTTGNQETVQTETYTINTTPPTVRDTTPPTVTASPTGGTYNTAQSVTLTSITQLLLYTTLQMAVLLLLQQVQ